MCASTDDSAVDISELRFISRSFLTNGRGFDPDSWVPSCGRIPMIPGLAARFGNLNKNKEGVEYK